jgi:uncharacterized protein YcfJ
MGRGGETTVINTSTFLKRTFITSLLALTIMASTISTVNAGNSFRSGVKGAAAGALIGAAIGGSDGAAKGAMIGGGVGLIAGGNDRNHRKNRRNRPNHHKKRGNKHKRRR